MVQDAKPLDAQESNPVTFGWTRGFPPASDKTTRFTDLDYFVFPKLRWTVCHFRELMPSVAVKTGTESPRALLADLDAGLDGVSFATLGGAAPMTWQAAFDANHSDRVLVLHKGRMVYERYDGCLDAKTLHGSMSVTKYWK